MDNKTALHSAARRYRQDRFSEWIENYNQLEDKEGGKTENLFKPGFDYSDEAYAAYGSQQSSSRSGQNGASFPTVAHTQRRI
jgi:hypothetical protein